MTDARPKLSWSDLAGARAGIWGLGREGHANLRKLLALGGEPVLVDDRSAGPVDGRPGRPCLFPAGARCSPPATAAWPPSSAATWW